ncbi:hypothetical protein H6S82_08965 [Planktothrix sp. FACHB-1355]|uniref:Uncharacterized protein n=1 Tax=Aerosakkonema funiforme FACHB-1375 TaxID=2949571 RepID=A0A926VJH7_9CYAN|nr:MULTISPECIES: hypothetical protein [Oscillatoriales]MBD2185027.1 hypothetical protein [Aerosakkonema funiforme FACHB-1375]MBD3558986.1 hypothetical protein [Planktothrix sp. FACHB-1355]
MPTGRITDSQNKLEKFAEALDKARKMQQEWITYGLDFVDLYVRDADGDWLTNWGEAERSEVAGTGKDE